MTVPKRIHRQRTRGWRMPPGTIYVGRPTCWGNPYVPCCACRLGGVQLPERTAEDCVLLYRCHWMAMLTGSQPWRDYSDRALLALRGRDLACWCRLDQPCHADVLLDLANLPRFEGL